jgi:hypothetical protein
LPMAAPSAYTMRNIQWDKITSIHR